jgi:hypothetical protein
MSVTDVGCTESVVTEDGWAVVATCDGWVEVLCVHAAAATISMTVIERLTHFFIGSMGLLPY